MLLQGTTMKPRVAAQRMARVQPRTSVVASVARRQVGAARALWSGWLRVGYEQSQGRRTHACATQSSSLT